MYSESHLRIKLKAKITFLLSKYWKWYNILSIKIMTKKNLYTFFLFSLILLYCRGQNTAPTPNNYFRSGSAKIISAFELTKSGSFTFTFASAFQSGTPLITYALKEFRNQQVANISNRVVQGFSIEITLVDSSKLEIGFTYTQGLYNLAINYLGVENNYPRSLNFINNLAYLYVSGFTFTNSLPSNRALTHVVNYTLLAGTNKFNRFTGSSKIRLFLSAFQSSQNLGQVSYWISSSERISIEVTPTSNLSNIRMLKFNLLTYDASEVSNPKVAPSTLSDNYFRVSGGSTAVSVTTHDFLIFGIVQFNFQQNSFTCALDFKWQLQSGTNNISINSISGQSSSCGQSFLEMAYFSVISVGCQAPYKFYNKQTFLCLTQCPVKATQNTTDSTCVSCPYDCQTCQIANQQLSCLACNSTKGRVKNGSRCLCAVGTSQSLITSVQQCVLCSQVNGGCQQCVTDSFNDNYNCTRCSSAFRLNTTTRICQIICIGKQNSLGTSISYNQCRCASSFVWNFQSLQCWRDCSTISNSPKLSASLTTCSCNSGLTWSTQLQKCIVVCTGVGNSTGIAISDLICQCNPGLHWYLSEKLCARNCQTVSNSPKTLLNLTHCNCNQGFKWDAVRQLCQYDCSGKSNSPGTFANDEECNCNQGLVWDRTLKQCLRDCSNDTHALNGISATACACKAKFIWNVNDQSCWVDCSLGTYTKPALYKRQQCQCLFSDYAFYLTAGSCSYNCLNLQRTTGQLIKVGTCECQRGYINSNGGNNCYRDCTGVPFATYFDIVPNISVGPNANSCSCRYGGYILDWNNEQMRCTESCSTIIPSRPEQLAANCQCPQGQLYYPYAYFQDGKWNGQCLRDCTGLKNSFQVPDRARCLCKFGYRYISTIHQCVRQCVTDPYSLNGQYLNQTTCKCKQGYYFNREAQSCWKNCSKTQRSNGVAISANQCQCTSGNIYSEATESCNIDCLKVEKSMKENNDIDSCKCFPEYVWSRTTRNCIFDCTKVANSAGVTADDGETCFCLQGYNWKKETKICQAIASSAGIIIAIVLGSIVGIVILGLLGLLIYKLVTRPTPITNSQTQAKHNKMQSNDSFPSQQRVD